MRPSKRFLRAREPKFPFPQCPVVPGSLNGLLELVEPVRDSDVRSHWLYQLSQTVECTRDHRTLWKWKLRLTGSREPFRWPI